MEKEIKERLIKISGKISVGRQLNIADEVEATIKGAVVKTEIADNQDGTVNVCAVVKPLEAVLIEK
jgi:hypothetical protein